METSGGLAANQDISEGSKQVVFKSKKENIAFIIRGWHREEAFKASDDQ